MDKELDRKNREAVSQAWDEMNPYNEMKPSHLKTLIDLLDDFFQNCVDKYPKSFLVRYADLGTLTRCRKGCYTKESDVFPPPLEIAKKFNIVNRWNPPGKTYLYAAHSWDNSQLKNYTENEFTCFEEMRAEKGTVYTFAEFHNNIGSNEKQVLNMDYTGITQSDIEDYCDDKIKKQANKIAAALLSSGIRTLPPKEQIRPFIESDTQKLAIEFVGNSFLLPICQTIFTPIDDDKYNDGEGRDRAYKSFHILADYLESKGIAGVIYPSTRAALRDVHTQNAVLFYPDDFSVVPGSLRAIECK